jgi:hypothetical protein
MIRLFIIKTLVAGYLASISEKLKEQRNSKSPAESQEALVTATDGKQKESLSVYSQNLIKGELTAQMMKYFFFLLIIIILFFNFLIIYYALRLTQKIYKKMTDEDFPAQFGSRYKLRCPALEFVKYGCKILSLDKNVQNEVSKLKRDLLTIVNVREFSDEAQYVDPSLSFTIPQVKKFF